MKLDTTFQRERVSTPWGKLAHSQHESRIFLILSGVEVKTDDKIIPILSGYTFGKRNFDEIDRARFSAFAKRNFDEIDRAGFGAFHKRNFDELDRARFGAFHKRNFDELDNYGFGSFNRYFK